MGVGHDVVPHQRRDGAAGHAFGRRIVIVAHPHRAGEIARVANEPGVTPAVGRAGLAGDLDTVELGPFAGAVFDHRVHHRDHVEGNLRADHLLGPLAVAVEAPPLLTSTLFTIIFLLFFLGQSLFLEKFYINKKVKTVQTAFEKFVDNYEKSDQGFEETRKLKQEFHDKTNAEIQFLDSNGLLKVKTIITLR